ncbi:MAG: UDP-N-acetylmuramate--L-alanine ligase [Treponema sp.]|jgi:UDP-N-acetylmuramate--alanine ligase|nr:UDP-N-acetylmuramate--L-alanine ligase [Treponema sp.]
MEKGNQVFFAGIKGTGMCALAELMHNDGIPVSGSDTKDVFYTDAILKELGIPYVETFDREALPPGISLAIYSAAYSPETNPQLVRAQSEGVPLLSYPEALGAYSARFDSSGIAGVHGKTTTTAMAGTLIRALGLPAKVLAGSAVSGFGGRSTLSLGDKFFVAETCEYRRHFLFFHPRRIVLTAVESDHQDYYPDYQSILDAFVEYGRKLPPGGELIYCADDPGASEAAGIIEREGRDIRLIPYGLCAGGDFRIEECRPEAGRLTMRLAGFPGEIALRVPGQYNALNAAAALALTSSLVRAEYAGGGTAGVWNGERAETARRALEEFSGTKRRQEITGEAGGVLFMDDYGHHPTAIRATLAGLRAAYPGRRLLVSFMSHTSSRTAALLDEFAAAFEDADIVFFHKIYASAREDYSGGVTGRTLFERARAFRARRPGGEGLYYTEEPLDAAALLQELLCPGDLFLTMGAGDNWRLGQVLLAAYQARGAGGEAAR